MTSVTRISHNPANSNGPKSVCNREGSGGRERDEGKGQAKVGNEGTAPFPQKTLQEVPVGHSKTCVSVHTDSACSRHGPLKESWL